MRINVVHIGWIFPAIFKALFFTATLSTLPVFAPRSLITSALMPKPASSAKCSPAAFCVFHFFENETAGAFTQNEAVAVLVPGTTCMTGLSLRVDNARAAAKPPIASGVTHDSAPPATITSASPYSIMRAESPMQWVAVVHAVTMARFGPLKPNMIDKFPAIILIICWNEEWRNFARTAAVICVAQYLQSSTTRRCQNRFDADPLPSSPASPMAAAIQAVK